MLRSFFAGSDFPRCWNAAISVSSFSSSLPSSPLPPPSSPACNNISTDRRMCRDRSRDRIGPLHYPREQTYYMTSFQGRGGKENVACARTCGSKTGVAEKSRENSQAVLSPLPPSPLSFSTLSRARIRHSTGVHRYIISGRPDILFIEPRFSLRKKPGP